MLALAAAACLCACGNREANVSNVPQSSVDEAVGAVLAANIGLDSVLVRKGVEQAALLWGPADGTATDFVGFVKENIAPDAEAKRVLFDKLSAAFEAFNGAYDGLTVELTKPLYLDEGELASIDYLLGSYSPGAHFTDDMFAGKVAFITVLNFPNWSLAEKNRLGTEWSRLEWAYARMGDMFTERIPAEVQKRSAEVMMDAENYIAGYNIKMGHLISDDGRNLFPEDMSLLSHWNLRDELKTCYADIPDARQKQEIIYKVMERIVCQEIPQCVTNNSDYDWNPYSNEVFKDGGLVEAEREQDTRYQKILDVFHSFLECDAYCPDMPDAIQRNFEGTLEMSAEEIESLFEAMLSSPQVAQVGGIIKSRLGRGLRPYDIWYDGFKSRSVIPVDVLTAKTKALYPSVRAFQDDTPRLLRNMGFSKEESDFIASHVVVEDARGSGHAWTCVNRNSPARLRTRVGDSGMDYEGYNIAVHEFGHNTEMVLDLYHIDHYMLFGVPNTAFTEAMAFLFQCRDLQLLGYGKQAFDAQTVLDHFWSMYEIMGVSLVDMNMWRWLYDHKDATASQLRVRTLEIARDIWNRYYEPVLGTHDSPVLAIYSHMVNSPMYLPNYPLGYLIHFQIEQHLAGCADSEEFARELARIYELGRLTPDEWMRQAIGSNISVEPVLKAVQEACGAL